MSIGPRRYSHRRPVSRRSGSGRRVRFSSKNPSVAGDRQDPVPQTPAASPWGSGSPRGRRRRSFDADHRCPDVQADLVHPSSCEALMTSSNSLLVAASTSEGGNPTSASPRHGVRIPTLLRDEKGFRGPCTAAGGSPHPARPGRRRRCGPGPSPVEALEVLLVQVFSLMLDQVEVGQRHQVPVVVTGLTCSTSSIQREVIHAHGHRGSNQKSATVVSRPRPANAGVFTDVPRPGLGGRAPLIRGRDIPIVGAMSFEGEYEPSPEWVRNQVAEYESSGIS